MYAKAGHDYVGFWAELAKADIDWHRPFTVSLDDAHAPNYRWFTDGQLNVSHNCLDVHLRERGEKVAILFEGEPRRCAQADLCASCIRRSLPVRECAQGHLACGKGDRVVIYMPLIPEAVIAMQACARIGAVHSVVFGGFSANAVKDRIEDAGAKLVITADGGWRGGHPIELKRAVDKALADGCPTVQNVIVYARAQTAPPAPCRAGRDQLVAGRRRRAGEPPASLNGWMRSIRSSCSLHLRIHRQTEGHATARERGISAQRQVDQHDAGPSI